MKDCPHVVWALRQRGLSAPERVVLIYLADKANSEMVCWPAIETICEQTELSDKTVRRAVQRLAELHLIRIEARRRHTHRYHVLRPINGLDGDPMQPAVGDAETVERSEIPTNVDDGGVDRSEIPISPVVDRSDLPPNEVERSNLPVKLTAKPPNYRSDLPPNGPSLPVRFTEYPPKKESPKKAKGSRARPSTPLAEDWQPTHASVVFAQGLGITEAGVRRAADRMRDWSVAGDKRMVDWDAAFRNWLRRDADNPWGKPKDEFPWYAREIMAEGRQ